ncbi:uncharacterized protein V6R79_014641 [Siganus canaliculatus]
MADVLTSGLDGINALGYRLYKSRQTAIMNHVVQVVSYRANALTHVFYSRYSKCTCMTTYICRFMINLVMWTLLSSPQMMKLQFMRVDPCTYRYKRFLTLIRSKLFQVFLINPRKKDSYKISVTLHQDD